MATERGHARPRRVSLGPLSRIANKLAIHRSDGFSHGDRFVHSIQSQSHPDTLHKVPDNGSATSRSSSDDFKGVKQVAKTLVDRDETQSAPHIISFTPSSRNDSGLSTQSRGTQRDDEEPEPRESIDRYGSESDCETHVEELTTIAAASKEPVGTTVTFRARIHTQRRMSRFLDFLLFRDQTDTIQGVLSRAHPNMVRWVQKLNPESIVQVTGTLQKPPEDVRSASHSELEVNVDSIYLVSEAHDLPFSNYRPPDSLQRRMEQRVLDLRNPANQALFRVRAAITRTFRNVLEEQSFMEIQTPKLQPAATESGAAVFKLNYFGRRAFLAQSPQLAKQMAISADFGRVYEIGPVFRAENSNTHRHLTEYTGLDLEMTLESNYYELIRVLDNVLKSIFRVVQAMPEMEAIRQRWPSKDIEVVDETPIIPFTEGIQMLRDDGRDVEEEDLSTPDEVRLGELVKEKYKTDFYVLDKFPKSARPFYTHKAEDPNWTNSFDIFVRGQEICTGGQRINDAQQLRASMQESGIAEEDMKEYLGAFDIGAPPHGGAGLGLDRLVALLLDLGDIRYGTLFYRDPKSLPARPPSLPHPGSDTTKPRPGREHPPIEELIANYGDASNTSWLDNRFEIWRHHTGAAVGYVRQGKLAMVVGDPLCDRRQYPEVAHAFVDYCLRELRLTPIWMLVSEEVQDILGRKLGWRTLSCVEEHRADADQHAGRHSQAARRIQREGLKVHEVSHPDEAFIRRADASIERWKASRKGRSKQVHLTEVRPWVDASHRRYFAAEKDDTVHALVVLARLAPRHGWQVKWALDMPNAPNGAVEVLVEHALSAVSGPVTFGVGAAEKLTPGAHLGGAKARFLEKTYDAVAKSLGVGRKSEFREKFGILGEQVYICYPKRDVTVMDLREIVRFFES